MEIYLVLLLVHGLLLTATHEGSGCVANLPPYRSYTTSHVAGDQVQAIVPSYRFSCSGRVTGWGGCFSPADSVNDRYYMVYQVWRERSPGCYHLVGPSSPPPPHDSNLLRLERGCNKTVLSAGEQLLVEEGDVLGFYVDYWRAITRFTLFNITLFNITLFNINRQVAGLQVVPGTTDVEVHYTRDSLEGLRASYAVGSSSPELCSSSDTVFSGYRLHLTTTGAPVITVMFEPAVVQTMDPTPDMMTSVSDQQPQPTPTTITFSPSSSSPLSPSLSDRMTGQTSGHGDLSAILQTSTTTTTSFTTSATHFTISFSSTSDTHSTISTPHTTPATRSLYSQSSSTAISFPPPPTPTPSPSPFSLGPTPIDTLFSSPVLLFEDDNSSLPRTPYITGDRYTTLAIAATLLVLLNILLITGTILLITLCVRRRYKQQKKKSHTISGPHIDPEPVRYSTRQSGVSRGSLSLNRHSHDTITMVSNLLYGTSTALDPALSERDSAGERSEGMLRGKSNARLAPDSMIYNRIYADLKTGKTSAAPQTTSPAPNKHVYSTTDSEGYEYIGNYR